MVLRNDKEGVMDGCLQASMLAYLGLPSDGFEEIDAG